MTGFNPVLHKMLGGGRKGTHHSIRKLGDANHHIEKLGDTNKVINQLFGTIGGVSKTNPNQLIPDF